jgi:hypothetical protein
MMRSLTILFICAFISSQAAKVGGSMPAEIIAGQAVGPVQIGENYDVVIETLTQFPVITQRVSYPYCGNFQMIEWYDKDLTQTGMFIYLKAGKVYQIESETKRFRTPEKITEGSFPEDVRRNYPGMEAYELRKSAGNLTGWKNLIFWVDQKRGIAFSFYYDTARQRPLVYRVIVFTPGLDFQPSGCVTPPQELKKLRPYSLEPANHST